MKYTLQPYSGMWSRYTCPQCHRHKVFTRYIDTETLQPIADHVGRCSRENNCGYHVKPSDHFGSMKNNGYDFSKDADLWLGRKEKKSIVDSPWSMDGKVQSTNDNGLNNNPYLIGNIIKNNNLLNRNPNHGPSTMDYGPSHIHPDTVNTTLETIDYNDNNFVQYLITLFGLDVAHDLVASYRIGNSSHWPGATIFWQIDITGKVRTGKIMLYNRQTGKRVKEPFNHITWVHSLLRKSDSLVHGPSTMDHGPNDFHLQQCLFGEHLLAENPEAIVAIVESEKTAIMASAMLPGFVWLAAGSLNNLNERICKVLQYRQVLLFPDLLAYDKWKAKAQQLQLQLPGTTFKVFAALEQFANDDEKKKGLDLGDLVGRG
ncbi:DUF6371 domain-containing protein [Mucilaginibacter sp.]|uniref:DUF6371 domain-containing protein n=1 Tax=Mucilaginibacter sp. TaxID=1882438 RepID=UPI002613B217|nr:DUF6371 domain-containing protein [Mucilaginibacter sp.]MDB4921537.1 hypothetical protein [Mucilaginibacter sp.]